jgi:hypothetical protein
MVTFVWSEVMEATAPIRRMSRSSGHCSGTQRNRARFRPDRTYQPSAAAPPA